MIDRLKIKQLISEIEVDKSQFQHNICKIVRLFGPDKEEIFFYLYSDREYWMKCDILEDIAEAIEAEYFQEDKAFNNKYVKYIEDLKNYKTAYDNKQYLFAYEVESVYGTCGSGWSFFITNDDNVYYEQYKSGKQLVNELQLQLSEETITQIRLYLTNQISIIDAFPDTVDNDSCDGNWNKFVFLGKGIRALNIFYHEADEQNEYSDLAEVARVIILVR